MAIGRQQSVCLTGMDCQHRVIHRPKCNFSGGVKMWAPSDPKLNPGLILQALLEL